MNGALTVVRRSDAQERAGRTAGEGRTTTKRSASSCSKKTDKVRAPMAHLRTRRSKEKRSEEGADACDGTVRETSRIRTGAEDARQWTLDRAVRGWRAKAVPHPRQDAQESLGEHGT